jgi:hypothetical protein
MGPSVVWQSAQPFRLEYDIIASFRASTALQLVASLHFKEGTRQRGGGFPTAQLSQTVLSTLLLVKAHTETITPVYMF